MKKDPKPKLSDEVLEFFRATGAKGGKARARKLTAKQRSEIAKKAVRAREAKKKKSRRTG